MALNQLHPDMSSTRTALYLATELILFKEIVKDVESKYDQNKLVNGGLD